MAATSAFNLLSELLSCMRVYNTLTKESEEFKPLNANKIIMYVCGLTPYDHTHIGHTRTYIAFDVIKRYFILKGYNVYHIQNITDVDDKILKRARETVSDPKKLTEQFHNEALELFHQLGILRANIYPKVSEHISEIISFIKELEEKGFAYETPTGIYFDIAKFSSYGSLSGQRLDEIRLGARVEVDETKANPIDFALWKKTEGELLEWPSPWGTGRPGWHIECSAISRRYGGLTVDIHGGARDLIFPHHENERAQSEAANTKQFVRYWLHTGFLTVKGEKMSKSLGNFVTLRDTLSKFTSNAIRLFFLQTHYRNHVDYNEEKIASANEAVEYILNSYRLIKEKLSEDSREATAIVDAYKKINDEIANFYKTMDNDFDTPNALAALFNLLRLVNAHLNRIDRSKLNEVEKEIVKMLNVFGISIEETKDIENKKDVLIKIAIEFWQLVEPELDIRLPPKATDIFDLIIKLREKARKKKMFDLSDKIRARLKEIGILLEDKKGKVRWKIQ